MGGIEQHLPVGAVVDEKGLFPIAAAEVPPQQRENTVFWFDLRAEDTAEF